MRCFSTIRVTCHIKPFVFEAESAIFWKVSVRKWSHNNCFQVISHNNIECVKHTVPRTHCLTITVYRGSVQVISPNNIECVIHTVPSQDTLSQKINFLGKCPANLPNHLECVIYTVCTQDTLSQKLTFQGSVQVISTNNIECVIHV